MKVEVNKDQLNETKALVSGISVNGPKVLTRALNKTATKGKTLSSKKIREQVSLKAAYVNSKLKVHRASYKKLTAKISAEKRGVLMTHYTHTALKKGGVSVKIKRSGSRKRMDTAFKTVVYAGGKRVEVIALPAEGFYKTGNKKMDVLYSPSVSQVFDDTRNQVDDELNVYLLEQTEKELQTVLRGY